MSTFSVMGGNEKVADIELFDHAQIFHRSKEIYVGRTDSETIRREMSETVGNRSCGTRFYLRPKGLSERNPVEFRFFAHWRSTIIHGPSLRPFQTMVGPCYSF
jgi:hypothetical protein